MQVGARLSLESGPSVVKPCRSGGPAAPDGLQQPRALGEIAAQDEEVGAPVEGVVFDPSQPVQRAAHERCPDPVPGVAVGRAQHPALGERVDAEVIAKGVGADPAGVAFEALEQAEAKGADVLMIDTAGRLQNKGDLMAELAKVVRVLKKFDADAPHTVLLVLDATTGQNALNQVQIFREIAGVTNLVVTKLDGSARGGIVVAIAEKFGLPINAIGVGEGIEDFEPFDAHDFARAIAGAGQKNDAAA